MKKSKQICNKAKSGNRVVLPALLLIVITVIGYSLYGVERHAGPASGTEFNGPLPNMPGLAAPGTFRVTTYNIHGGKGVDGRLDLDRIKAVLEGADVSGLNEAKGAGLLESQDQVQILGQKLNMSWLFVPTETRWGKGSYGNGILSNFPSQGWVRIPLETEFSYGKRNVLIARLLHPDGPLNVLVTHVVNTQEDRRQLQAAITLFLSLDEPAIMMGDLNNRANESILIELLDKPGVDSVVDRQKAEELKLIDWIFYRGLKCVDYKIHPKGASDHPAVIADFIYPNKTSLIPSRVINFREDNSKVTWEKDIAAQ